MPEIEPQEAWNVLKRADCLYSGLEVEQAIDKMAFSINQELRGKNPVVVCVMNGGIVPFGKLLPKLDFVCEVDYVHATRYRNTLSGSRLSWVCGPNIPPKGRTVLLVDDILDEGITLEAIVHRFREEGAAAVHTAVLVVKERERQADIAVDYAGLTVPDRYVFGYGMDYKGFLRNAPGIYAENESKE